MKKIVLTLTTAITMALMTLGTRTQGANARRHRCAGQCSGQPCIPGGKGQLAVLLARESLVVLDTRKEMDGLDRRVLGFL